MLARGPSRRAGGRRRGKELQAELKAADALMANKQWDEAIAAYKAILAKAPHLTMLNLQIGAGVPRMKKDYDGAIAAYQEVLKAEPEPRTGVRRAGQRYMQKGDFDKAEERWRRRPPR